MRHSDPPHGSSHVIPPYASWLIRHKARQLIGRYGFVSDDRKDIEQELALDLLRRLSKFNPELASQNTFIARVVDHKIASMIEHQEAQQRDYRAGTTPIEDLDERTEPGDRRATRFDKNAYLEVTRRAFREAAENIDRRIDLARVLDALMPDERQLAERLVHESVTEISRSTGIPRSTLYDAITKIRARVERAGLRDYITPSPTARARPRYISDVLDS